MKKNIYKLKGFTLIEVIIAVSLSVILLGALYAVYITSYQSYRRSVAKAEINQNARIALERITRDLRQTERITTTLPIDDTDPLNPAPSTIMFQDGHVTDKIQYIEYSLTVNELHRKLIHYCFSSTPETCDIVDWVAWNAQDQYGNPPNESIDEDAVKADKISVLKFYGNKLITIDVTATHNDQSVNYQTKTLGRNIQ